MASNIRQSDTEMVEVDDRILRVRDTTVQFDMDRGTSRVLDGVDIDIRRNEVLGVVGESGSGKSMFASALLDAVVHPGRLDGEITFYPEGGEPIDVLDLEEEDLKQFRWEHISMVFQGAMSSFNPTMSIGDHFRETLDSHGVSRDEGMERGRKLLEDVFLDPERILNSYPHELSGGMSQRALIALSLLLEPDVLIMDEPTAALDLLMQRSILSLIDNLQASYDLTIVFITHDLPLIAELTDRVAVLYAFQFVEIGKTRDIILKAAHPYTRALLNSTPNLDASVDEMEAIEGSSPDPVSVPSGCSYHPRCPLAVEECKQEEPPFHRVSDGHLSACYYWDDVGEKIPSTIKEVDK